MNEIQIILNIISHILFNKYTNVLRWTIISWQALAEYLQIELFLRMKHSFSMSLMFAKLKFTLIHSRNKKWRIWLYSGQCKRTCNSFSMLLVQLIQTLSFSGVPLYRPISRLTGATSPLNLAREFIILDDHDYGTGHWHYRITGNVTFRQKTKKWHSLLFISVYWLPIIR